MLLYFDLALFIGFLVTSGFGLIIAKIALAMLGMIVSVFCLWMLLRSQELLKPRALWLTSAFFSVILLTAVSLICNFPSP